MSRIRRYSESLLGIHGVEFQQEAPILGELNPKLVPGITLSNFVIKLNWIPATSFLVNDLTVQLPEIIHSIFALQWEISLHQDGHLFAHFSCIPFGQSYQSKHVKVCFPLHRYHQMHWTDWQI